MWVFWRWEIVDKEDKEKLEKNVKERVLFMLFRNI
jgi:hypothetical protein